MKLKKWLILVLTLICSTSVVQGYEPRTAVAEIKVFDCLVNYDSPLSSFQMREKPRWRLWAYEKAKKCNGDLCLENSRMAIMLRIKGLGPELYYKIADNIVGAATLIPVAGDNSKITEITSFNLTKSEDNHLVLKVTFRTGSGQDIAVPFIINADQPMVEIKSAAGLEKICLQSQPSYAIIPDLFADDVVVDVAQSAGPRLHLPADNHSLLQMIDNGSAIIVCDWTEAKVEVEFDIIRNKGDRPVTHSIINFAGKGKVAVAIPAQRGIWHELKAADLALNDYRQLDWIVPFPAYWRIDYRRSDRMAPGHMDSFWNAAKNADDSFKMMPSLLEMEIQDGQFILSEPEDYRHLARRSVINPYTGCGWWTHRGWFLQSFYIQGLNAYAKLPRFDSRQPLEFNYFGEVVIYPLLSVKEKPKELETVEDVWRQSLGENYLEILDLTALSRRSPEDCYCPTCPATQYCESIFLNRQEMQQSRQIRSILTSMNLFLLNTRRRLQEYVDWQRQLEAIYAAAGPAGPAATAIVRNLEEITDCIPRRFSQEIIPLEPVGNLIEELIRLTEYPDPQKILKCGQVCSRIRLIGNTQDETLGEFRDAVETVRQRAALLHLEQADPDIRHWLRQVRSHCRKILRVRYDMEGK